MPLDRPDADTLLTLVRYTIFLRFRLNRLQTDFGRNHQPRFLDAFAKLRKVTISFAMSVRPSVWNNSASTGRIFMKLDI